VTTKSDHGKPERNLAAQSCWPKMRYEIAIANISAEAFQISKDWVSPSHGMIKSLLTL